MSDVKLQRLLKEVLFLMFLAGIASSRAVLAETISKPVLLQLRYEQRLNAQLPLDLTFRNDEGQRVRLRSYFGRRPVILLLGYSACPMLCSAVLNGMVESLQEIRPTTGNQFDILFVSIDPAETPVEAAARKRAYVQRYGRAGAETGWHFLVGEATEIKSLADAVGFQYAYDQASKQFAHPSGLVVVTPQGRLSRYFYGVQFPPAELSVALRTAAADGVGSRARELFLLCFQHVPLIGKNSGLLLLLVRGLAVGIMVGITIYVTWAVRQERARQRRRSRPESEGVLP
ncbi:MAG: SCO family protein [Verrucomicrobiota bacterium]